MKARLLKRVRRRYKIVLPLSVNDAFMATYTLMDNKKTHEPVYNYELEEIKKVLLEWIKHDYPQSMKRPRVVEVWF